MASGPALSAYPESCTFHPFARALHLGLDTDYAVPVALDFNLGRFAPGRYLVRVRIRPAEGGSRPAQTRSGRLLSLCLPRPACA